MQASDLEQYTDTELRNMAAENRQILSEMKFNNRVSPVENPAKMKQLRRDIARILTVLNQRQNAVSSDEANA
jgi:large subunit ribosomal protein L29